MNTSAQEFPAANVRGFATRGASRLLWNAVRVPTQALLIILEPILRVVLCLAALLGVFTAFFYRFFTDVPHFPFWAVLAGSVACLLLLMAYYRLVKLFS